MCRQIAHFADGQKQTKLATQQQQQLSVCFFKHTNQTLDNSRSLPRYLELARLNVELGIDLSGRQLDTGKQTLAPVASDDLRDELNATRLFCINLLAIRDYLLLLFQNGHHNVWVREKFVLNDKSSLQISNTLFRFVLKNWILCIIYVFIFVMRIYKFNKIYKFVAAS